MKILSLVAAGACAAILVACGGGGSSPPGSDSTVLPGREGRPDVPVPEGPPPSKLVAVDLKKGSGPHARDGDTLSVRYFSLSYKGHHVYEDNWREPTAPFVLGEGQRVEAWEDGLPGIQAGGRRELVVPGGTGSEETAPEIYVVEAISVTRPKQPVKAVHVDRVAPTGAKPAIARGLGQPPKKLVVRVLKQGSGPRVYRGYRIGARFIDINYKTRTVQDFWGGRQTSIPAPYVFVLGQGEVRPGWEMVIPGKRLGTRLELLLPSRLAYGKGPMRYVVELIEREKSEP